MLRKVSVAVVLLSAALTAGCGGGSGSGAVSTGSTRVAVSGSVADGYLANATVFMDKNGNYRLDAGEPTTGTGPQGSYTLDVDAQDVGKYPIVALAVEGVTVDLDHAGETITRSYLMSLPASAVSGTVKACVSPFSTLVREKLEAHPGMSIADATAELRSQMNLPPWMDVMGDFLAPGGPGSSDANKAAYQVMHAAAQNMAALMAAQADLVFGTAGGGAVDVNRFRTMMGSLNVQLPQMIAAMQGGVQQSQTVMSQIGQNMRAIVSSVAPTMAGMPFRNMTALFPPMRGIRFWNMTGNPVSVFNGMMGWWKR